MITRGIYETVRLKNDHLTCVTYVMFFYLLDEILDEKRARDLLETI